MPKWVAWTDTEVERLVAMRAAGKSVSACADVLGRSFGSVKCKLQNMADRPATPTRTKTDDTFHHETKGDTATIASVSERIRTPADALAFAEIDADVWMIDRQVVNSWEVAAKTPDGFETRTLWQVKLWLKRRAAKFLTDALESLIARTASHKPAIPTTPKKTAGPYLVELSLFDVHFGKLAWAGDDFNVVKAESVFADAVNVLLDRVSAWDVSRILIPVGNDFYNVDNWQGTTGKGTPQDNDGPFARVFEAGCMAMVNAIDRCLAVAPVDLLWVPGNHDPSTSFYLVRWLDAWYRHADAVTVDRDHRPRKYVQHGCCLLGFTHGNEEAHRDLPAIMAAEVPDLWAATTWREIHLGHFHRARQTIHRTTDEFGGVRVRVLPSLSGIDSWHFGKGYVQNKRAAEAYLWHADEGYAGHVSANVQET